MKFFTGKNIVLNIRTLQIARMQLFFLDIEKVRGHDKDMR